MVKLSLAFALLLGLTSCALITTPLRVAGNVVKGTGRIVKGTGKTIGTGVENLRKTDASEAEQ